jgi:hypothetical protein
MDDQETNQKSFRSFVGNRWLWLGVTFLYVATWVFGWYAHSCEIKARAQQLWITANQRNEKYAQLAAKTGEDFSPVELNTGGPRAGVDWCFPVLPGLLIADSEYVIGPVYGRGGVKLVLFYGIGSKELCFLSGWIS